MLKCLVPKLLRILKRRGYCEKDPLGNQRRKRARLVPISVLTPCEYHGLRVTIAGLAQMHQPAGVPHPETTYTDRGRCGSGETKETPPERGDVHVPLDIWHPTRRIASGYTTESHPPYKTFLG